MQTDDGAIDVRGTQFRGDLDCVTLQTRFLRVTVFCLFPEFGSRRPTDFTHVTRDVRACRGATCPNGRRPQSIWQLCLSVTLSCLAWEGEGGRGNSRSGMARLGERGGGREETWWVARKSEERALHVKAAHHKSEQVQGGNFNIIRRKSS